MTCLFCSGRAFHPHTQGIPEEVDRLLLIFGLLVALLVKADSPGAPVLFKQERLGKNDWPFNIYKFRTMIPDAERKTGPVLAVKNDVRVTKSGRLLRLTRLDELPQLSNVLKGEMSLVGPRPERAFFVEKYSKEIPEYPLRLQMKAGLTGLAQVAGKYDTSVADKLKYDLLYARSYSLLSDVCILFKTIGVVFSKDKAQ